MREAQRLIFDTGMVREDSSENASRALARIELALETA
jgi:hypothetical protein